MRRINQATLFTAASLAFVLWAATPASAAVLATLPNPIFGLPQTVVLGPPAGDGWTPSGGQVTVYGSPLAGPAMNIPIAKCNVDSLGDLTSSITAGSPCTFTATANTADGVYTLTATQAGGATTNDFQVVATGSTIPIASPGMTATPPLFSAPDTVTITGCGWQVFGIATNLDLYAAVDLNGPGSYLIMGNITVNPAASSTCPMGGSWSIAVVFPQTMPTGVYHVQAYRTGAAGAQSALVQANADYTINWTQPSNAAEAVSANPAFTG